MLFELTVKMPDNTLDKWQYETKNNHIVSKRFGNINPLDSNQKIKPDIEIKPFNKTDKIYKKLSDIKQLEINLGLHCNFNCTFCPQKFSRDKIHSSSVKDVDPFIEKLKKAKENGLEPIHIKFWGGEPLVYWKVFSQLLPKVRELYPDALFTTTSNGSLLTKEIVDTLDKYKCHINISHDAYLGAVDRDKDIFQNPRLLEVMKYAAEKMGFGFKIMPVLTDTSPSITEKQKYINSVFGREVILCPEVMRWNMVNIDRKDFNDETRKTITESACEAIVANPEKLRHILPFHDFKHRLLTCSSADSCRFYCLNQDIGLVCDLLGNTYNCKIRVQKTGTLENINEIPSEGNVSWHYRKECKDCLVLQVCAGGCVRQSDIEHEKTCHNSYFPLYYGMFKAVFKTTYNVDVVDFKRIEK